VSPRAQPLPAEPWFTVTEVARHFKVNPNRVYEWIRGGLMESTRLPSRGKGPGTHRIEHAEVKRFEAMIRAAASLPGQEWAATQA
jgi:hypothetical protein